MAAKEQDAPKLIIGDGETMFVCNTVCYHHDTYYRVGDKVIPPEGGDLPAEYFDKA